jgi:hypothetical protein
VTKAPWDHLVKERESCCFFVSQRTRCQHPTTTTGFCCVIVPLPTDCPLREGPVTVRLAGEGE